MATTSSTTTTPSPLLGYRQTNGVVASSKIVNPPKDAMETEERERAIQKFLASAELSKLTRGLRARLGYASYKANNNLAGSTLLDLEAQTPSQPISYPRPTFTPLGGSFGLAKRGSMGPPPPVTASAGQSLFMSLLGPPPAKRARTIRNPQDPHVPAPVRPAGTPSSSRKPVGSRSSINTSVAERTRSHAPKGSRRDTRKKPRTAKKSKGKEEPNDVEDMKAAATLTSLLMHSRPGGAASASSPRSSVSGRSEAGSTYSHLAHSSTRSVDHLTHTPSPPMKPSGLTPKAKRPRPAATDSEAAELMMYLATSPSPARATVTRDKDAEAFRALSGGAGLKGRVLFSGAEESRMLNREATGSFASTATAFSDATAPSPARLHSKRTEDAMDVEMDVTPPTPVTNQPQLLPPPASPPVSPNLSLSSRTAAVHSFSGSKPFDFLSTESIQNNTPHTPGNIAFNFNEFINVSPSPATPRSASAMAPPRMDIGRQLFADEHQTKGLMSSDGGRTGSSNRSGYLGAGLDFVRT